MFQNSKEHRSSEEAAYRLGKIHLTKAQYLEYINNYKKVKAKKTNKKEQLKMGYGTKQSSQNIKYNHLKILLKKVQYL